jgi:hypothetical protein
LAATTGPDGTIYAIGGDSPSGSQTSVYTYQTSGAGGGGGGGEPCPAGSGAQATQCWTANVAGEPVGELAIYLEKTTGSFGDIAPGSTSVPASVGNITYRNTLNNGQVWSSSVAATSLVAGSSVVPFTGITFVPGSTVTPSGPVPGPAGAFTGTDTTPGTTYSDPRTLVTAQPADQGDFVHSGSTASLHVPVDASSGTYSGTLQYTITG